MRSGSPLDRWWGIRFCVLTGPRVHPKQDSCERWDGHMCARSERKVGCQTFWPMWIYSQHRNMDGRGFPLCVQKFIISRGWILTTNSSHTMGKTKFSATLWNSRTSTWCNGATFCTDTHAPYRMNPFPLAPQWDFHLWFGVKMSWQTGWTLIPKTLG